MTAAAAHPTHNRHLDATRAIVASHPFPTHLSPAELEVIRKLGELAREVLIDAHRAVRGDHALEIRVETAGQAVKHLIETLTARMPLHGGLQ